MTEPDARVESGLPQNSSEWGVYLIGDAPLKMMPLALDDGSGDKKLLAEAIDERLEKEELDGLINELISHSVARAERREVDDAN